MRFGEHHRFEAKVLVDDKEYLKGVFGGEEEGGGVRSGPGAARTILLFHIISARPSKQPRMVRTFLKVYMELGSYFLFLQEQKTSSSGRAGVRRCR
jgi:hypothetical protein